MQDILNKTLRSIERLIPKKIYKFCQPAYHFGLSFAGKFLYRFPSRHIKVIGITGTKGKSSTTEYVNAVLEANGYKTSILSTIRFKIGDESKKNLFKMTMPGRFFVQKFLRQSVDAKCDYAIIEMTSEGSKFFRHSGVHIDILLVTNITPEHIESHGSFEKYLGAKLKIAKQVERSSKKNKAIIITDQSPHLNNFHNFNVENKLTVSLSQENYKSLNMSLPGDFNKANALLALKLSDFLNLDNDKSKQAVENLSHIAGRAEEIILTSNKSFRAQNFKVVIDYAHTVDSLEKIYSAYPGKKIAVLGACGGGRDKAKQPSLGAAANNACEIVIVTDEDPYDDDVMNIINNVASGITNKILGQSLFIEKDRRIAINLAIQKADEMSKTSHDVSVIISGKGTDPYIMRANNAKEKWLDSDVAREELEKVLELKNI